MPAGAPLPEITGADGGLPGVNGVPRAIGVSGVPETFVIDGKGIVRLRHLGPVTPEIWQDKLMPAIKALQ